ncbi:DUF502 domain-containing protein [Roseimarinus sediminis]|jgi:uncharacterized membrane protein|uniref:DUF502 domain-containing protein n=1 Tax=Roseimarinus sediminis TaxID=1610899 RepID=UPI003D1D4B89
MKKLISYFLQGVLLVAPLFITGYIIYYVFTTIDSWLSHNIEVLFGFSIPGMGIVILFVLLTLLGFIGQLAITRPVKHLLKKLLERIPLLNLLYSSLNDMFSAFVGKTRKFNTPVKVHFNTENNLWKLGFITKKSLEEIEEPGLTAVYFPHSYNFSGELYLVPSERVYTIGLTAAQTMKFIVSGGVTSIVDDKVASTPL